MEGIDSFVRRPRIAHITNHGYGGVVVPTGGALDTGGQNVYVNAVVKAMVELGYHVTVFARGGFPFYQSERMREGIEPFGEHARYVYVPGGGDAFIRKEDIAVALDEEVDWLDSFITAEAGRLGCRPWEVYEIVNTHYWDAGVMGMDLINRWRSLLARELTGDLLAGTLDRAAAARLEALDSRSALGMTPEHFVGDLLFEGTDKLAVAGARVRVAVEGWATAREIEGASTAAILAAERFAAESSRLSPALTSLVAADVIGQAVMEISGRSFDDELSRTERHVFTPHSLGVLKEENYRDRPFEEVRDLKFCERRHHEIAVCHSCRAFAATSTEIAQRLRTRLEVPTEQVFFFPPCVDRAVFRHYEGDVVDRSYAWLADTTGVAEAKLRASQLVFETSRMDRTKRKDLLLEAFAQVAREVSDVYLLIGGGPKREVFAELEQIRRRDPLLLERAFLLGFVPDEVMYPLFDLADLFVSASEMEGFGMSVAQAAAVGTPIVTSHLIPFAVQYVPDDALICEPGDVDGFARAIVALLRDPEDRRQRGVRLEAKTAELDWVVQSEAFLEHLRSKGMAIARPRRAL